MVVEQQVFKDRPQAARTGLALHRLARHGAEGRLEEFELDAFHGSVAAR